MPRNTKQVMLRIPPELYDRLKAAADMTMITPSAMARVLVKQQLDQWTLPGDDDVGQHPPDPADRPVMSRQEMRKMERELRKKRGK